jgi:hypothetical protein
MKQDTEPEQPCGQILAQDTASPIAQRRRLAFQRRQGRDPGNNGVRFRTAAFPIGGRSDFRRAIVPLTVAILSQTRQRDTAFGSSALERKSIAKSTIALADVRVQFARPTVPT